MFAPPGCVWSHGRRPQGQCECGGSLDIEPENAASVAVLTLSYNGCRGGFRKGLHLPLLLWA